MFFKDSVTSVISELDRYTTVYIVELKDLNSDETQFGLKATTSNLQKFAAGSIGKDVISPEIYYYWPIMAEQLIMCSNDEVIFPDGRLTTGSLTLQQVISKLKFNPKNAPPIFPSTENLLVRSFLEKFRDFYTKIKGHWSVSDIMELYRTINDPDTFIYYKRPLINLINALCTVRFLKASLLRRCAPRNDAFKNRTVQRSYS